MNDGPSTNDNSPAGWWRYVPGSGSSQTSPPRSGPGGITAGTRVPPLQRNGVALAGFILGIIGLVLCAGRIVGFPVLTPLFLVCGFAITFIGITISAFGCRQPTQRAKALWGLLFSCVAFILVIVFTFIMHPTKAETQGSGTIIGIVLLLIEGGAFGGLGAVLVYAPVKSWWEELRMLRRGVTVEGSITDRHTETTYASRGGGTTSYYVTYGYKYAGETYSHKQRVSKQQYQTLDRGSRVAIRCLSYRPKVALLVKGRRSTTERVTSLLLFLFGAAMLSLSLFLVIITLMTYPWGS